MKTAIQIGAGNIGRGFIGALLEKNGYHVIFSDVNQEIIDKINEDKCYTVHIMDSECYEEKITNISAYNSNDEALVARFSDASIITSAVGLNILKFVAPLIAKGIAHRMDTGNKENLNVIACENAVGGSSQLKAMVYEKLSDAQKAYTDEYIGFPNCSVDRIVPPVTGENIIDVVVENYYEWNVERGGFKGSIPEIEGMNLADELMQYIERKLFTLNTGHAIASYLGYIMGHKTVEESINDDYIYNVVKYAMTESGTGLIKKYDMDKEAHAKYIDKIINRFKNKYLNDDVARVGREPIRKLSPADRLVKPMMTAQGFGLPTEYLILGIGALLNYKNDTDEQSAQLQATISEMGLRAAVSKVSGIEDEAILTKIEAAYNFLGKK